MSNVKRSAIAAFALVVGLAVLPVVPAVAAASDTTSAVTSTSATASAVQPDRVRSQQ